MNINILILSAGRRVELVRLFQEARDKLGVSGKVVAVDISDLAPALYKADCYHLVPKINEEHYIASIIEVCKQEDIHLIIPTIDTELLKLSQYQEEIESKTNARLHLSDERVINICRDKIKTQQFFEENGFKVPRLINKQDLKEKKYKFPLFIKPLNGSSSLNTFKVTNEEELQFFLGYVPSPMVQSYIEGEEYTVDVFTDFDGNPITIVPRIRLATRSGEVAKAIVKKDPEIIEVVKQVIEKLKPIGHITIQCMKTHEGVQFIEVNPRFGGGAPISIKAGADSCRYLYELLLGKKLSYHETYEDQLIALRHDEAIFLNQNREVLA